MVKAFDLLDFELYTIQGPHDYNQLEDKVTDFEELLKELALGKRRSRHYGDPMHTKIL